MVSLRAVDISGHPDEIDTLTDEVKAKDLELQTVLGLVEEATNLQSNVAKLREAVAEDKVKVAFMRGVRK